MTVLVSLLSLLINLYIGLIIASAVLSWFNLSPWHPVVRFLNRATDPVLAPIRSVMGTVGPVDFSPMAAIFILMLLRSLLVRIL